MQISTIITWQHNTDNLIIRDVPVSSTIIETNRELMIIDTGMAGNRQLAEELAELGYTPADFNLVINTHLHCDHTGGNRIFTNARIIISKTELEFETKFALTMRASQDPVAALRAMGRIIDDSDSARAWAIKQLQEEYPNVSLVGDSAQIEFFEDHPSLPQFFSVLKVPGHSIDSRAFIITGQSRQAIITGDAFYHRDLWQVCITGINYNDDLFRKNARRLSGFKDIIIPGHDRPFDNITGRYISEDRLEL